MAVDAQTLANAKLMKEELYHAWSKDRVQMVLGLTNVTILAKANGVRFNAVTDAIMAAFWSDTNEAAPINLGITLVVNLVAFGVAQQNLPAASRFEAAEKLIASLTMQSATRLSVREQLYDNQLLNQTNGIHIVRYT